MTVKNTRVHVQNAWSPVMHRCACDCVLVKGYEARQDDACVCDTNLHACTCMRVCMIVRCLCLYMRPCMHVCVCGYVCGLCGWVCLYMLFSGLLHALCSSYTLYSSSYTLYMRNRLRKISQPRLACTGCAVVCACMGVLAWAPACTCVHAQACVCVGCVYGCDKPAEICQPRSASRDLHAPDALGARGCVCLHGPRHARVCMHMLVCVCVCVRD